MKIFITNLKIMLQMLFVFSLFTSILCFIGYCWITYTLWTTIILSLIFMYVTADAYRQTNKI